MKMFFGDFPQQFNDSYSRGVGWSLEMAGSQDFCSTPKMYFLRVGNGKLEYSDSR